MKRMAGQVLCQLSDIADGAGKGFELQGPKGSYLVFVIRKGDKVYGYQNVCPHLGTPLDWAPDSFLDLSGQYIRCATHGAMFRIEDGYSVSGPCEGDTLEPIKIILNDGALHMIED